MSPCSRGCFTAAGCEALLQGAEGATRWADYVCECECVELEGVRVSGDEVRLRPSFQTDVLDSLLPVTLDTAVLNAERWPREGSVDIIDDQDDVVDDMSMSSFCFPDAKALSTEKLGGNCCLDVGV